MTLEKMHVGRFRNDRFAKISDLCGPTISKIAFSGDLRKTNERVFLAKPLLNLLYERFTRLNSKRVVLADTNSFDGEKYFSDAMGARVDTSHYEVVHDKLRLFWDLCTEIYIQQDDRYVLPLWKYLPELMKPEVQEELCHPYYSVNLLDEAWMRRDFDATNMIVHPRWTKEWEDLVRTKYGDWKSLGPT